MSDAPNKKDGRPFKAAAPGTRASLGLKVTAATKAAIEDRAKASGRTQSQEAELLIEMGIAFLNNAQRPAMPKMPERVLAKEIAQDLSDEIVSTLLDNTDGLWESVERKIYTELEECFAYLHFNEDGEAYVRFRSDAGFAFDEEAEIPVLLRDIGGLGSGIAVDEDQEAVDSLSAMATSIGGFISELRKKKLSIEAQAELIRARLARSEDSGD